MCLIVVKPKGKNLPTKKQLKQWFAGHPDGFGLAYPCGEGKVRIRKGAMTPTAMLKKVKRMKQDLRETGWRNVDVIFHFRQATNGEISPANCHPFPITKNQEELAATNLDTKYALAHNGIIGGCANLYYTGQYAYYSAPVGNKTDTQEFIEDYLADLGEAVRLPAVQALIRAYSESKFALLTPEGVEYIGKFIEEDGWWFSNAGYKLLPTPVYAAKPSLLEEYACVNCNQQSGDFYATTDDSSLLCADCFTYFEGRKPSEADKVLGVYDAREY